MSDKIEITYVEFDDNQIEKTAMTRLHYCEWKRGDKRGHAFHDDSIPDDVRIALALLVAPGLVCPVGEKKGDA